VGGNSYHSVRASAEDLDEGGDLAGHNSGEAQDPIEIEDFDEVRFDYSHARELLRDLHLLDLFEEESDNCEEFNSGHHRNGTDRRTFPPHKGQDQRRLQQQRDYHVGSTIRILQGLMDLMDHVQRMNTSEEEGAVRGIAELLKSEIAASGTTMVLVELIQIRTVAYRKDVLRAYRELLVQDVQD
jgi:hypothetical protein